MTLITLKDVGVTLGSNLFSGLNFTLNKGDQLGLVAANGCGKSTLLKCIAGVSEITEGDITRSRGLRPGLVEQEVPNDLLGLTLYQSILHALPPEQAETESWRVDIVLDDLKVPEEVHSKELGRLSGGWRRVALLGAAWIIEPDVLLLDEPTNHLDLSRIGVLQSWLLSVARGVPFIVASHDRAFLDAITNRTLFLREDNSCNFALPYTPARASLHEADKADARRFSNDMKQAQQLRRKAAKLKNIGVNSGSDLLVVKTKQLNERADKLEHAARPAHFEGSAGKIQLPNSGTHAKALVSFDNADVLTPNGTKLFNTGKVWLKRGDRVAILGGNGTGKSRLVSQIYKAISEHETPDNAQNIFAAPALVLGYCDQEQSQLDVAASPIALITSEFDVGDQRARSLLAGAGFSIDLQSASMQALSAGQRMRLAMLLLRLTNPNFYLLDEPTNHLDIEGQEALEIELKKHDASCLLVSHDRTFVRAVANRYWLIKGQDLVEIDGPEGFFDEALGL